MPRIDGTTDSQSAFLRAFRLHQGGPPPEAWPSPAILRRWLRHDGFRRAYADIQRMLNSALAFQSLTTALAAAQSLHETLIAPTPPPDPATAADPVAAAAAARAQLQRERFRHRAGLAFLRLAHSRLARPPQRRRLTRRSQSPLPPEPHRDDREVTVDEAAMLLKHPI